MKGNSNNVNAKYGKPTGTFMTKDGPPTYEADTVYSKGRGTNNVNDTLRSNKGIVACDTNGVIVVGKVVIELNNN